MKRDRLNTVQTLQREISLNKNRQRIGNLEEILLDGQSKLKNGQMMGRTRGNRIVNVRCPANLIGQIDTGKDYRRDRQLVDRRTFVG